MSVNISTSDYYVMTLAWMLLWMFVDTPLIALWFFEGLSDRYHIREKYTLTKPAFTWWRAVVERISVCLFMTGMGFFQLLFIPTSPHAVNNIYRTAGAIALGIVFAAAALVERYVRPKLVLDIETQRATIAIEALRRFIGNLPDTLRAQVRQVGLYRQPSTPDLESE